MTCAFCGAALPAGAMFCGECGHGVRDTPPAVERAALEPGAEPGPTSGPDPAVAAEPAVDAEPEPAPASEPGSAMPEATASPAREPEPEATAAPAREPEPEPEVPAAPARDPGPAESEPEATAAPGDVREPDPGTAGAPDPEPARFVLQFSTGESVQVSASGLIGRNPRPEPGEVFDEFVTILDPGRSVSKTHLEFGQDEGWFWVCDRFSGNGTVLREPGAEPRRCEPGRRYRVARGSRVELGDQFMIVS